MTGREISAGVVLGGVGVLLVKTKEDHQESALTGWHGMRQRCVRDADSDPDDHSHGRPNGYGTRRRRDAHSDADADGYADPDGYSRMHR